MLHVVLWLYLKNQTTKQYIPLWNHEGKIKGECKDIASR